MVVLFVGITYSMLPGISMIGHIVGLVVGTAIALSLPLNAASPTVADAQALSSR